MILYTVFIYDFLMRPGVLIEIGVLEAIELILAGSGTYKVLYPSGNVASSPLTDVQQTKTQTRPGHP